MKLLTQVAEFIDVLLDSRERRGWRIRKWLVALLPLYVYFPALLSAYRSVGTIALVLALMPSIFWGIWLGPNPGSLASSLLIVPHYFMFRFVGATLDEHAVVEMLIAHTVFGTVTYFIANGFHLRKSLAEQLEMSERAQVRFRGLFDRTSDMVFILDLDTKIIDANDQALILLGYRRQELLGKSYRDIVAPDEHGDLERRIVATTNTDQRLPVYERTFITKDGQRLIAEMDAGLIADTHGSPMHYQAICRDIRSRKAEETELYHRATHDELTGLYNRALFYTVAWRAVERVKRSLRKLAVLFIDLDGFKKINDNYGHHAGDLMLIKVAQRLGEGIRTTDTLARLGGDEFGIILEDLSAREEAQHVADLLVASLSEPYEIEGQIMRIGASCGISLFPDDETDIDKLVSSADMRMYTLKRDKYASRTAETDVAAGAHPHHSVSKTS